MIDVDPLDPVAPPRRNGELAFDAPWQARAFGMAMALLEHRSLGWDAFRRHLGPAIEKKPAAPYYEQFVDALAAMAGEVAGGGRPESRAENPPDRRFRAPDPCET